MLHEGYTGVRVLSSPVERCIGFAWHDFDIGGRYRGGFCEKLLEALPMSDKANATRLQDGPAAGQIQAHQRWW